MIRILLAMSLLSLSSYNALAQQKDDWANFSKYEKDNIQAPKGAVVFMGNSITEGWNRTHPHFFTENGYICRGIGGQTTMQMLVRFRKDVIDLQPKAVVILAGTNDIARNNGYISLENTLGNIISMVELAQANNIQVILCSVLPAYEFGWRKELQPASDIVLLNEMIRQYAVKQDIPYVDYHSALKDDRNGLPEKYAPDGVHPNSDAYQIMEKALKHVIEHTLGRVVQI